MLWIFFKHIITDTYELVLVNHKNNQQLKNINYAQKGSYTNSKFEDIEYNKKKSCIQETMHLSTNADSSTNSKKNPDSKAKFAVFCFFLIARRFCTIYNQKFSNLRQLLSITFLQGFQKSKKFKHWNSGKGAKIRLNRVNKWRKKSVKNFFRLGNFVRFILHPLFVKVFKSETTSFHYVSPLSHHYHQHHTIITIITTTPPIQLPPWHSIHLTIALLKQ